MQANLWHHKLLHFHLHFWFWKCGKEGKILQKLEYLENEKSFLDEIKNILHSFWRPIVWWKNKNLIKIVDTSFKFLMKTSFPNPVKSLGYIKYYSSSRPRHVRRPSDSIRYNCMKICSWLRRPKTILDIKMINNPIIYKFYKDFTNHRKKTSRAVVFSCRPYPNIFKYRDHQWKLATIWKMRFLLTVTEEISLYVRKFRLPVL